MPPVGAAIAAIGAAIGGAVATGVSFIAGLGSVGRLLIGVGLQLAANTLRKKKSAGGGAITGTRLQVSYGGSHARETGVGLFATAGQEILKVAFGQANKTLAKVYLLSDFPIDSIARVAINGEWTTLSGDNNSERGFNVGGDTGRFVRIKVYHGSLNPVADPYLVKNSGGKWTTAHVGSGMAYVIVYLDFDEQNMTTEPNFVFECRGKCYDPRKDSSIGGIGAQRWDNVMSWQFSDNPIVQIYTYSRGFYLNGELVMGKGMQSSDLPLVQWMAAMNACDDIIGGQKRYRSGFIFTAAEGVAHRDNLEPVLNACAGALVEQVEGDIPLVGVTLPVTDTITDDDLVTGENHTWQAKRSRSELINAVHGSFNDPERIWEMTAYPPQSSDEAREADGERHAVQIDFTAVFDGNQAARLALSALRENRYQASARLTVRPRWVKLRVGDWINWDSKTYGRKTYRIVGRSLSSFNESGARNVTLDLQEVGSGIYDTSVNIPENPAPPKPIPPVYQNFPDGLRAIPLQGIAEDTKRKMPIIQVSWIEPSDVTVSAVYLEWWQTSAPDRKVHVTVSKTTTNTILAPVVGETEYTIRATVIADPPRETIWGPEVKVTTLSEEISADIDPGEVADIVNDLNKWVNTNIEWSRREIDRINAVISDQTAGDYLDRQAMRRQLVAEAADMRADYTELIAVAVSETQAVAARIEQVEVSIGGNIASVIDEIKTGIEDIDGRVTANAQAITAINVKVDDVESSVSMKAEAQADPGGGWARWGVTVRTGSGNTWSQAAMYIDTQPGLSQIVMVADRFILTNDTDGNAAQSPFVFANGRLRLQAADIGEVEAGILHSTDNRVVFDLNAGSLIISD